MISSSYTIYDTRNLGTLQAPTSNWRPLGLLDVILSAVWALRLCDPFVDSCLGKWKPSTPSILSKQFINWNVTPLYFYKKPSSFYCSFRTYFDDGLNWGDRKAQPRIQFVVDLVPISPPFVPTTCPVRRRHESELGSVILASLNAFTLNSPLVLFL